jgi:hypothetical protein
MFCYTFFNIYQLNLTVTNYQISYPSYQKSYPNVIIVITATLLWDYAFQRKISTYINFPSRKITTYSHFLKRKNGGGPKCGSLLKEGGADAEEGGAFFDGLDVVLAHAHGEVFEFGSDDFDAPHFFEDFPEPGEAEAGGLRILGEGSHGHQADQLEIGQGLDLIGHGGDGTDSQAELLLFLAGVDFEEDFDFIGQSEFGSHGIDFFGQAERVHGVNQSDDREQLFHFVPLEVADHMPARPGAGRGIFGGT